MPLEAVIERVWRCTWRLRSCNSEIHLQAEIKLNSEMHLEDVIERVWRCTSRPRYIETGGEHGGGQSGSCRLSGRCDGSSDSIYWLTQNNGTVEN